MRGKEVDDNGACSAEKNKTMLQNRPKDIVELR